MFVGAILMWPLLNTDVRLFQNSRARVSAFVDYVFVSPGQAVWHAIFVAIFLSLCISIFISPLVRSDWRRRLFGLSFAINFTVFAMFCYFTKFHTVKNSLGWNLIDMSLFETLWTQRSLTPLVAPSFYQEILAGLFLFGGIAYVMCVRPTGRGVVTGPASWLPVGALAASILAGLATRGEMVSFPSSTSLLNRAILQVVFAPMPGAFKPAQPQLSLGSESPFDKIVLIVDESIGADYFAHATDAQLITPFLAQKPKQLIDFGAGLSAHNCSLQSRFMMRYGVRPADMPKGLARGWDHPGPTFWQYASKAGYETIHISGFAGLHPLQAGGLREAAEINRTIDVNPKEFHARDEEVLKRLVEVLKSEGSKFIFVEKFGVHTPYEFSYPPAEAVFDVGGHLDLVSRRINHYKNGIRWSVDRFFKNLLAEADLRRTLIIYTSDHGQNFGAPSILMTHCGSGPTVDRVEASVPMMVLAGHPLWAQDFKAAASRLKDTTSHFQIFPTLLIGMGYAPGDVVRQYGASLLGYMPGPQRFLVGSRTSLRWVDADQPAAYRSR